MDLDERIAQYLKVLRTALSESYTARNRHIFFISLLLFVSAMIVLISILTLIVQATSRYGTITVSVGAGLVLVIIFVILALILHGMSLGRMTSIMLGVLKSSMDILSDEIQVLATNSLPSAHEKTEPNRNEPPIGGPDRLEIARTQMHGIVSELESAHGAVQNQSDTLDMAVFAYGFAGICVLSTGVMASGSTHQSEYLRVLLLVIGMVCATACYAVLARPTTPQFLVEQTLRKLGLSLEALSDGMRARASTAPPFAPDEEVFEAGDADSIRRELP
ncbi:hypothetical protein [Roseateles chitinivorans]|uniref:hypothetical protein n=1 Tax=Roseateles chitinivorans TaxID=2917965 RepID=UPI003D6749CB